MPDGSGDDVMIESLVSGFTAKLNRSEFAPPGLVASSRRIPGLVIRLAGTNTVSCVELTNVTANVEEPNFTVVAARNPLPLMVSVKPGPPAVAELGLTEEMVGLGGLIVKMKVLEALPEDSTVTNAVPDDASRLVGTDAVNCVALTKVVANADPFHCTTDPGVKPFPLTVRVKEGNG